MKNSLTCSCFGTKIKISFAFLAVVTLMFIFDSGYNALLSVTAMVLHEAAHILMLLLCGGRVAGITLSLCELNIAAEDDLLNARQKLLVALSGPFTNIFLGVGLFQLCRAFALTNLIIGFFQLLPISTLDGDNALSALSVSPGKRKLVSLLLAFLFALLGFAVLLQTKYNFSILAISLYLLFVTLRLH